MSMRLCECGCGKELVRRPKEDLCEFKLRRYSSQECAVRARTGVPRGRLSRNDIGKAFSMKFHPILDKFLYQKNAT